jgi:pimeloyl-ACP methyl ester carboxylesterase
LFEPLVQSLLRFPRDQAHCLALVLLPFLHRPETDFTEDLKKFDVPTLILHGGDDQIVPIENSAKLTAKLVKGATLKIYPGGSHSLGDTSRDELNADLLAFVRS